MNDQPAKRIVTKREHQNCGCLLTEYSDGLKEVAPCAPCGLYAVARALGEAANAAAAVATTLKNSFAEQQVNEIARQVGRRNGPGPRPLP